MKERRYLKTFEMCQKFVKLQKCDHLNDANAEKFQHQDFFTENVCQLNPFKLSQ